MPSLIYCAIIFLLLSCTPKTEISPLISITNPNFKYDTIADFQRKGIKVGFKADAGSHERIESLRWETSAMSGPVMLDSIFWAADSSSKLHSPLLEINGSSAEAEIELWYKHAGTYSLTLYTYTSSGLRTDVKLSLRADSVMRPSLFVRDTASRDFPSDSAAAKGAVIELNIIAKKGNYKVDSVFVFISNSPIPNNLAEMRSKRRADLKQSYPVEDSLAAKYDLTLLFDSTYAGVFAIDTAGFSSFNNLRFFPKKLAK
jgi:hypothetical protein